MLDGRFSVGTLCCCEGTSLLSAGTAGHALPRCDPPQTASFHLALRPRPLPSYLPHPQQRLPRELVFFFFFF